MSRKKNALPSALPMLPDYACLSKAQVLAATGLSEDTFDRVQAKGEGPAKVFLSARRVGYPVGRLRAWLATREESAA